MAVMFFELKFYLFFTVSAVFTQNSPFPPYRIVKYRNKKVSLFRRVEDSCCSYYVQQDQDDVVMFYVNNTKWTIGKRNTTDYKDSSCPVVTFKAIFEYDRDNDFDICHSLDEFSVVDEDQDNHNLLHAWFGTLVGILLDYVPNDADGHCLENLKSEVGTYKDDLGEDFIFITEKRRLLKPEEPGCRYTLASEVRRLKSDPNSKVYLYNQHCVDNSMPNISCIRGNVKKKTVYLKTLSI